MSILYINYGMTADLEILFSDLIIGEDVADGSLLPSELPGEYFIDLDVAGLPPGSYHVAVSSAETGNNVLTGYITYEATGRYRLFRSRDQIETAPSNQPIAFSAKLKVKE